MTTNDKIKASDYKCCVCGEPAVALGIGGLLTHVDYVHELQHALRLCGIEKEIEP